MRISDMKRGEGGRVAALPADAARSRFLCSLGLVPGTEIEVVFRARFGAVIRASGVRVAMSCAALDEVEVRGFAKDFSVRQSQFGQKYAV